MLPAGAGTLTVRVRAVNTLKVRLYLTHTGTGMFNENQLIGQDTNGRDGWTVAWRYQNEPLLAHLTVTAVGAIGATSPWVTLGLYHPESAAAPGSVPAPGTTLGLWPVRNLAQARTLQDVVDAGHQPWLLSPELVSISYAATELDLFEPVKRQVPGRLLGGFPQLRVGGHPVPGPARPPGRRGYLGRHRDRGSSELVSAPVA